MAHLKLDGTTDAEVEAFLTEYPPSRGVGAGGWISAGFTEEKYPFHDAFSREMNLMEMKEEFTMMTAPGQPVYSKAVVQLATKYGDLHGKWLFYVPPGEHNADKVWRNLVRGMHLGTVKASGAKVCSNPNDALHVFCVYVEDFTNAERVLGLERGLRETGIRQNMFFKPDAFTYLGIYSGNQWGIKPHIYFSKYNSAKGDSKITSSIDVPK